MARGIVVGIVLVVAIMLYSVFDCAARPRDRIAALPKWGWILVILLLPVIGAALWFLIGRKRADGGFGGRKTAGPPAPDDDPDFLQRIADDVEQQQRRERRERGEFD
ncbi:MAG: PLD nuclease N-terminal domain-containing protein [Brevibacterium yomogidense]|uniref:Membrane protein n=1 Tax=Brevibacterium yomogidense TaxID=946573 RepID=A0A1X6XHA7_9MICO|nr:PLD nuclease N-terminal domain-containing protein [Brevibacterium yomogidense]SLM98674.1 Membrane protein [Brevibacterium yomogidense]